MGMGARSAFEDEQIVWTPRGNKSLLNMKRSRELFPATGGYIGLLAEARDGDESILSLAAFQDIEALLNRILETKATNEDKELHFSDVCIQVMGNCFTGENPTTFAQSPQGVVDFSQFADDAALLAAI
mmetsp:Transcript_27376/g.41638  ORF Transcript_27376/g.41638 Transcript_27376/m.41638 type:complete len:128 (+) Transcript_27376:145-528(+)